MNERLASESVRCPYCGAVIALVVDASAGDQRYVEDCSVCCRPIECALRVRGPAVELEVRRDDE
jgi:hypothetical protein